MKQTFRRTETTRDNFPTRPLPLCRYFADLDGKQEELAGESPDGAADFWGRDWGLKEGGGGAISHCNPRCALCDITDHKQVLSTLKKKNSFSASSVKLSDY